jgi:hypothetical protein
LVTRTLKLRPLSPDVAAGIVKLGAVAPAMSAPLRCHC